MSSLKFRCLDDTGSNFFYVDTQQGVKCTLPVNATSFTSGGALTIAGGGGFGGDVYIGGNLVVSGTVSASGSAITGGGGGSTVSDGAPVYLTRENTNTESQTMAPGPNTVLFPDTGNSSGSVSYANGAFTVSDTGLYFVHAELDFFNADNSVEIYFLKNNDLSNRIGLQHYPTGDGGKVVSLIYLEAGDNVRAVLDNNDTMSFTAPYTNKINAFGISLMNASIGGTASSGGSPVYLTRKNASANSQTVSQGLNTILFPSAGDGVGDVTYSDGVFSVATTGLYNLFADVDFYNAVGSIDLYFVKNNIEDENTGRIAWQHFTSGDAGSISALVYLEAGDNVRLALQSNSTVSFSTPHALNVVNSFGISLMNASGGGESVWSSNANDVFFTAGNVGIGTSSPTQLLTVAGDIQFSMATVGGHLVPSDDTAFDLGSPTKKWRELYLSSSSFYLGDDKFSIGEDGNFSIPTGVRAAGKIVTDSSYLTASDARIKDHITDISSEHGLSVVRNLHPKTFTYTYSDLKTHGFIAQDVAEVLPVAVDKQAGFIPDICVFATTKAGAQGTTLIFELKNVGLKVGALQIVENGQKRVVHVDGENHVQETIVAERVFVYGHGVEDFHTLDKDVIFTMAVSAIQHLDKTVSALEERISILESKK